MTRKAVSVDWERSFSLKSNEISGAGLLIHEGETKSFVKI